MSSGKIIQIIGAVIDVEFPRDQIPKVYDALTIDGTDTTLEVQQQLGDGVVRTIAMGSTEGLRRGLDVTDTGQPVLVVFPAMPCVWPTERSSGWSTTSTSRPLKPC